MKKILYKTRVNSGFPFFLVLVTQTSPSSYWVVFFSGRGYYASVRYTTSQGAISFARSFSSRRKSASQLLYLKESLDHLFQALKDNQPENPVEFVESYEIGEAA